MEWRFVYRGMKRFIVLASRGIPGLLWNLYQVYGRLFSRCPVISLYPAADFFPDPVSFILFTCAAPWAMCNERKQGQGDAKNVSCNSEVQTRVMLVKLRTIRESTTSAFRAPALWTYWNCPFTFHCQQPRHESSIWNFQTLQIVVSFFFFFFFK